MFGFDDFDSPRALESMRKKTVLYRNGVFDGDGVVFHISDGQSLPMVLNAAGRRLGFTAQRLFDASGIEIDDVMLIANGDVLFVSAGHDFIQPRARRKIAGGSGSPMSSPPQLRRRSSSPKTTANRHVKRNISFGERWR